jgi:hypothetical protein
MLLVKGADRSVVKRGAGLAGGVVSVGQGTGHGRCSDLALGVGVGDRPQVPQQASAAPDMHGLGQMLVAGIAVADQDTGEFAQHTAGVDVVASAATDVHHGQVLGAGDVHMLQPARGAASGFVSVQHRREGQRAPDMLQEPFLQFPGSAAPKTGQQPSGHIDPGQCFQKLA